MSPMGPGGGPSLLMNRRHTETTMTQDTGRRPDLATFARRLLRLRREWNVRHPGRPPLTQERLAEQLGVDPRTVRDWEGGRQRPRTFGLSERLARFFDVSVEQLGLPEAPYRALAATGNVVEIRCAITGPPEPGALVALSETRIEIAVDHAAVPSGDEGRPYTVRIVDRRTFLSLALALPVSLTLDHVDRLGMVLTTSHVDALAAEGLERMAAACWRAHDTVPPAELMPHVQWQIRFLDQLRATSTALQSRVTAVLGSMCALAGDLSFWAFSDAERARRYYEQAQSAAADTENHEVAAFALGSLANLVAYGKRDLAGARRLAMRSQEVAAAGASPGGLARAAGITAVMHAGAGDELGFLRSIELARTAHAAAVPDPASWIGSGSDADYLRWHECGGLMRLRRPEAIDGLQRLRETFLAEHDWAACNVTSDLAEAFTQAGEIAEGCRYAEETLTLVARFGHGESVRRVKALCRGPLHAHGDHASVRALVDHVMTP